MLALALGLLVVFGILAPVFTGFFGLERTGPTVPPTFLILFAAGFAFYFGGMAAAYKAPNRPRLHGALVAPVAFLISPVVNVLTGSGPFPGLANGGTAVLVLVFFLVALAAAYVGGRRGQGLYDHNQRYLRRRAQANEKRGGQGA